MDQLTLTLTPDDDGTAELRGRVHGDGFAGSGSAWFNVEALEAFCASLAAYPIELGSAPSLAGGYWNERGDELREVHLAIRLTPLDSRGAIQVSVQMGEPAEMNEPANRSRSVSTWFVVGYNDLHRFQSAFAKVLAGAADEAVLASTLG